MARANGFSGRHQTRRDFLNQSGAGLGGIALATLLGQETAVSGDDAGPAPDSRLAQIAPQARSVIWFFMLGGTSHMARSQPVCREDN